MISCMLLLVYVFSVVLRMLLFMLYVLTATYHVLVQSCVDLVSLCCVCSFPGCPRPCVRPSYEEFTRLAETRLAESNLDYLKICQTTLT